MEIVHGLCRASVTVCVGGPVLRFPRVHGDGDVGMIYLKRLAVVVGCPLWFVGFFVCIALDITGISYLITGEIGAAVAWWTEDLPGTVADWVEGHPYR